MPNRLAAETSPYLRQHADNPVDWWPWNAEALAAARAQGKPILLSIGYSACHWCHVMAHESFEDEATARAMNEKFICIKVDREERPDLDKIYQLAHQALTRRGGGWPLTVFLAPDDLAPFYAGTYFPKDARYGMPPFTYVLEQVRDFWDTRRNEVRAQNAALREFLDQYDTGEAHAGALDDAPIHAAFAQIERHFDPEYGGHLGAPKFPHCPEMELLLDLGTPKAREMVELTLTRMAEGGIHDQIGGGFCRYSVDERWEIPHFEKMLYDNAQLLPLYAQLSRQSEDRFDRVVERAMYWIAEELTAPGGAFCAALDADSEGEEGKFYVWQRDEVAAMMSADEFAVAERFYGFDQLPNFEKKAWNPIRARSLDLIAEELSIPIDEIRSRIRRATGWLRAAREQRVRPSRDDKVLTAWNGLLIAGLARASRLQSMRLSRRPYSNAMIERPLKILFEVAWRNDRLYASIANGAAKFPGYLDDYAFLLDAILEVLQNRWHTQELDWGIRLANSLLTYFEDHEHGGFYFTAHDHEELIQRPKPFADEALPSGNGVAARALQRLGHLLGETRWLDAAERTLRAAWSTMQQMPQACATLQRALMDNLDPRTLVVVRFDTVEEEDAWRTALHACGDLRRIDAYFIPVGAGDLPGTLGAQKYVSGGVAYVCRGLQCDPPTTDANHLAATLATNGERTPAS